MRVATLASDLERELVIAAGLADRSDVELVLRCVDRVEALAAIRSGRIDALIGVGRPEWFDLQCRDEAAMARIRALFIEEGPALGTEWSRSLPTSSSVEEIVAAVRDSDPLGPSRPRSEERGRLVAVWGPKGCPGRSRVAIELSCELAEAIPTLLIDADPYGGDIVQLLGILDEVPTVIWASRMAAKGELEEATLEMHLKRIGSSGPSVLPGLPRGELWAEVSSYGWRELLNGVTALFGHVVADVGFCLEPSRSQHETEDGRNHMARHTVVRADHVVAVCRADPVGVKNFLWAFAGLRELRDATDITIVANRTRRGSDRDTADLIRRHLGKRVGVFVPDSPGDVDRATSRGLAVREVQPDSDMRAAFRALAVMLGLQQAPSGVLTRLAGRKR